MSNPQESEIVAEPLLPLTTAPKTTNNKKATASHNNNNNTHPPNMFRSRRTTDSTPQRKRRRRKNQRHEGGGDGSGGSAADRSTYASISSSNSGSFGAGNGSRGRTGICRRFLSCIWRWLTRSPTVAANSVPTQQAAFSSPRTSRWMGFFARFVLWTTVVCLSIAVIWYSYELFNHGTDPHLVAWFSAGGFVLLGFPISMWAIVSHLANYNQPHVQVYIVRILWMVPLYSVGSWLAMRFRDYAIYIETVRDLYESYVLYSFLQFLIQVLGGEEALVLMLKDKSPTRGVHMWGLQWCVKPWLMGQPYRKTTYERTSFRATSSSLPSSSSTSSASTVPTVAGSTDGTASKPTTDGATTVTKSRSVKSIMWKSPFFVRCKFGVLQYVLLKFVSTIVIMILEHLGWYHEGDFSPRGGYLYICFITNLSQCWALYCLVLFYYATHNELSPIRPVGKFLSVKALVFFTWWQSVMISYLLWMDMIPAYTMKRQDWSSEDVAKGLQDYLICVEMFLIAIVHSFVFPHSEYTPQAVEARSRALNLTPMTKWHKKRLGRSKYSSQYLLFGRAADDHSTNTQSLGTDVETELVSLNSESEVMGWSTSGGQNSQFGSQFTTESPQHSPYNHPNSMIGDEEDTDVEATHDSLAAPSLGGEGGGDGTGETGDVLLQPNSRLDPGVDMTEQDNEDYEEDEEDEDEEDGEYDGIEELESSEEGDSDADAVSGDVEEEYDEVSTLVTDASTSTNTKPGFMHALLESAIPTDMVDSTVGIVKGEYNVERKTLLNHATASDQYDLFSPNRRPYSVKTPESSTK